MEKNFEHLKRVIHEEIIKESQQQEATYLPPYEEIESGEGMPTLYRVAFKEQLDSIFKYGYNRTYTGKKGGNRYGPGVYCTFTLADSIKNVKSKPIYGDCIVMMKLVGGYNGFVIFNEHLAKQTYGQKWQIYDQFITLGFEPKMAARMYKLCVQHTHSLYHGRTAGSAVALWNEYGKSLYQHGVRGLIYKGNLDGHCALPYDFSSVIPYAVSFDQGRTFRKMLNREMYDYLNDHADVEFHFGNKYDQVLQSINGFTMVQKDGKFNIVDNGSKSPISKVWFDGVRGQINPEDGSFGFTYRGYDFYGNVNKVDGESEKGYVMDTDGSPFCLFSDLDELVDSIKEYGCKDFAEYSQKVSLEEAVSRIVREVIYESRTVDQDGTVTIDNFDDVCSKILDPSGDDDVWFVQIIKRHKDNMHLHFDHNACEYITYYLVHNAQELMSKRDEIISVCKATNSRAYMHPNKRSLISLSDYANNVLRPRFERHRNYRYMGHEMEVAAGQSKDWPERKLCFLDIDSDDERVYRKVMDILSQNGITPLWEYRSMNNGWHILLPDKEQARHIDFSVIDNGHNFGRFSTVGLEIDKPILLYASLKPNGYGLQQSVQRHKMGRRGYGRR